MVAKKTAKKTAAKSNRATRTRAELEESFTEVRDDATASEEQDESAAAAARTRASYVRESTKGVSVDTVLQNITNAKLAAARSLDDVAEQLTAETAKLEELREAVELETTHLEELHGKEIVVSSIKTLLSDHDEKVKTLQNEYVHKQNVLKEQFEAANKLLKEQFDNKKKESQRSEEEYNYSLQLARKKAQDQYEEEQRVLRLQNEEKQRKLNLDWSIREDALSAKEQEIVKLVARVDSFPGELEAAVKKAESIVGNTLKREYEHKAELANANNNSQQQALRSENKSLVDINTKLAEQVAQLTAQLTAANNHIQKISESALTSASGQAALSAVQQFQQNGNGSKPVKQ